MIHQLICIIFLALWELGRVSFGPRLERRPQMHYQQRLSSNPALLL